MTQRLALICLFAVDVCVAGQSADSMLARSLAGPLTGVEEIVFAVRSVGSDGHWYANFGHRVNDPNRMMYGPDGGRLCRLNLRTGKVVDLVNDPGGGVRDPQVHYDGRRLVFSYRPGGTRHYHLYAINVDGTVNVVDLIETPPHLESLQYVSTC